MWTRFIRGRGLAYPSAKPRSNGNCRPGGAGGGRLAPPFPRILRQFCSQPAPPLVCSLDMDSSDPIDGNPGSPPSESAGGPAPELGTDHGASAVGPHLAAARERLDAKDLPGA